MSDGMGLLQFGSMAVFGALGLLGVVQWRRRPAAASFWLALLFTCLALLVVVGSIPFDPDPASAVSTVVGRVLGALLLCVPYLQYRFMATFSPRRRVERAAIGAVALVLVATVLVVPDLPVDGEPYTGPFAVLLVSVLVYWVLLTVLSAVPLWRDGARQPTAARLRMRTMSVGLLGLAVGVVLALTGPRGADTPDGIAVDLVALICGVVLLAGFAPPPALRAWWRQREGVHSWELAREMMAAPAATDVARACTRYASRLFGGRGALLVDGSGAALGGHGLDPGEADRLAAAIGDEVTGTTAPHGRAQRPLRVPCGDGWLVVEPSAYTPFFGKGDADELRDVAALAELALTRLALHRQARSSHEHLTEAQSLARVGSWEWDSETDTVSWSDELYRLHGLTPRPDGLRYAEVLATVHPDDRAHFQDTVRRAGETRQPFAFEHRVVHPDGTVVRLFARGKVTGAPGEPVRLLGACQDVTERRGLEEALAHGALHDPLTGLANRMMFTERLSRALARREQGDGPMAVLLLDLDDFASVNDTLGPAAGDEALRTVAARLRDLADPVDTVARLGADQFAILLEDSDARGTTSLADHILAALTRPLAVPDGEITVTASIGIMAGASTLSAGEFLRNADAALRAAKCAGKDSYRVFENGMHESLSRRLALRTDLQRAVSEGQLRLAYQPIVSLADDAVLAVEALVRWEHPALGAINPAEFIPIAEESGAIVPIGQWVLEEAVTQLCDWQRRTPALRQLGIHVNVSARELLQTDLVERFASVLGTSGLDPALLTVEITESVLMGESDASVAALEGLRGLGVLVAIDDFGTGYSSLSYLRRLPVDVLKIDKAFIDGVTAGPEEAALARAIMRIASSLRLAVVAEGVEAAGQANWLRAMGCAAAQGFYFSPPLTAEQVLDHLAARPDPAAAAG